MNAILAAAMTELADLAYELYAETFDDLRTTRLNTVELFERVHRLEQVTGAFEAEALSLALCDYLANAPRRSLEQFRSLIVPSPKLRRCAIVPGTLRRLRLVA